MPLLQRIEQCALTDSAGQTLAGSWHQVTALPWQVSGRFGVQPDSGAAAIVFMTVPQLLADQQGSWRIDRKSTRLNSSHVKNSYAVFCLKKKTQRTVFKPG